MNDEIKRLAKRVSEGDTMACHELARHFFRSGYLQLEGNDFWLVKEEVSGMFWGGGNRKWSKTPHLYSKGWSKKIIRQVSEEGVSSYKYDVETTIWKQIKREYQKLVRLRIRYLVLEKVPWRGIDP